MNPRNKKLLYLDQDSWRNHQVNKRETSKIENSKKSKLKSKAIQRKKIREKLLNLDPRKIRMKLDL